MLLLHWLNVHSPSPSVQTTILLFVAKFWV